MGRQRWTTNDIPDQRGRVAIVTGANTGLGYETARALTAAGATTIIGCRSREKGEAALARILAAHPGGAASLLPLDLADLASVRTFAEVFSAAHDRLDLLINNAGVMAVRGRRLTTDGFEMHFGVNHLGHFALTGLLLPLLQRTPTARVVTVSSSAHTMGRIGFGNLQAERFYNRWWAYAQSKLANLLFAFELDRRWRARGVDALSVAAHPGYAATDLQRHMLLGRIGNSLIAQSGAMGALTTLYAATDPSVTGGAYYGPAGLMGLWGYPARVKASPRAYDEDDAVRLWAISDDLSGVSFDALG